MNPKLVKTSKAHYEAGVWSGTNNSGIISLDDAVLILPDKAAETIGDKALLYATDAYQQQHSYASETGVIVDVGPGAFQWAKDRAKPFDGRKPKAGDRVVFERYAGQEQVGSDGVNYRLMDDKCVRGLWA